MIFLLELVIRFDLYNRGEAASTELERLAEDGTTGPISQLFAAGTIPGRVLDATIATVGPISPGTTVVFEFEIEANDLGSNDLYFSYASMVVPSVRNVNF
jgi:hypothetical protein